MCGPSSWWAAWSCPCSCPPNETRGPPFGGADPRASSGSSYRQPSSSFAGTENPSFHKERFAADIFRRLTAPGLRVRGVFGRRTGRGRCARRCRTLRSSANEAGHVTRRRADCRSRQSFAPTHPKPPKFVSSFCRMRTYVETESLCLHELSSRRPQLAKTTKLSMAEISRCLVSGAFSTSRRTIHAFNGGKQTPILEFLGPIFPNQNTHVFSRRPDSHS